MIMIVFLKKGLCRILAGFWSEHRFELNFLSNLVKGGMKPLSPLVLSLARMFRAFIPWKGPEDIIIFLASFQYL